MGSQSRELNFNELDTRRMQELLKGDSFPVDAEEFLNDDVRIFFETLLEEKQLKKSDIIRKANLSRVYGYQLMEGRRRGKRDYYLLIALAMSLDLKMTQRMLSITHCGALHPLIKRDAALIFAINHHYDCSQAYHFMSSLELPPLEDGTQNA